MIEMGEESNRKKYERNIVLWLTILGVPLAVSIGVFSWMGFGIESMAPCFY